MDGRGSGEWSWSGSHYERFRTLCGLAVGGGPIVGFLLYKYVVGGVKGDCRNIFHERSVCGFLRAVLEQQFQARLVVWSYVSAGANLKWENFYICTCDV